MHKLCEGVEATCQRPVPVPLTGESLLKALPHIGDCIMRLVMLTSVHAVGLHPQGLQLVQRDVMSEEAALERWQGHVSEASTSGTLAWPHTAKAAAQAC